MMVPNVDRNISGLPGLSLMPQRQGNCLLLIHNIIAGFCIVRDKTQGDIEPADTCSIKLAIYSHSVWAAMNIL
jgi:hypothetical protein